MSKVFLSHSSKDKEWYVSHVYKYLVKYVGEQSVVIDEVSFQQGRVTSEEILYGITNSDLFVIFLSNNSLDSEWVQDELKIVEELVGKNSIQICPIIIEDKIKYDDRRIPQWLSKNYNIQLIKRVKKAADVIYQRMLEISYQKYPRLKELSRIFVGRNKYLQLIEERLDDFEKEKPIAIIASGLDKMGRSSLLKKGMIKSNIVRESFNYPEIVLRSDESIEDCILKLSDLGFSTVVRLEELSHEGLNEKIGRLSKLIDDLQKEQEIVLIRDYGCIVNHEGKVASWFYDAVTRNNVHSKVTFLIASKFKYYRDIGYTDRLYALSVNELTDKERRGLLKRLLEIDDIDMNTDSFNDVVSVLSGLPEQVQFTELILKEHGFQGFELRRQNILEFNNKKAAALLQGIKDNNDLMGLLLLLSSFDYVSVSFIMRVVESDDCAKWLETLHLYGITEYVGVLKEYVRVNDAIKDYVQRSANTIPETYSKKLRNEANIIINQLNERDSSDYSMPEILYSLKSSMKEGMTISDSFIIPSIYLKTMNDLYYDGKYEAVIKFADKALQNKEFMDDRIVFELRYLLCLSLAQTRDKQFTQEVKYINGADHDFLYAFYYRRKGLFAKAYDYINKSLLNKPSFSKAKREKVQILIGMQDYEGALELAKENYENYKDNPYHIHAYYSCLIKTDNPTNYCNTLKSLLLDMDEIDSNLSKEMAARMRAQYTAIIDRDYTKAKETVDKAITMRGNKIYGRFTKFEIAEKFQKLDDMKDVIKFFDVEEYKYRFHDNIVYMKSIVMAMSGQLSAAEEYFKKNIRNYTDSAQCNMIQKLKKIAANSTKSI